ncbi:MAG: hypothetical protein QF814_07880 [Candidatus Marinimicrobia bacterium]|jgi:hypothetical protein|nr:hypothetical protein [Candidatus Neomarinimicrobiota bacterium]|tara:strand:- start:404 stop:1102 length:699 start_codon:yes stop_codon:yes gene_type:complete
MKRIILLTLACSLGIAQTAFAEYQFEVKRGGQQAIKLTFDEYFGEVNYKSGGVNFEAMRIGNETSTHRFVFYGDPANWGWENDKELKMRWRTFLEKINNHIEDWTHSSAGDVISWKDGDEEKYRYIHLYEFKASDEKAFNAAHDKIVKKLSPIIGDREVGFGTYEIGGYGGATHWVVVTAESFSDYMIIKREMAKNEKAWGKYYDERGKVEYIRNYTLQSIKRYSYKENNEK